MYSHFFPAFFRGTAPLHSHLEQASMAVGGGMRKGTAEALSREISCQKRLVPLERGISPLCFAAVEMTRAAGRSIAISQFSHGRKPEKVYNNKSMDL